MVLKTSQPSNNHTLQKIFNVKISSHLGTHLGFLLKYSYKKRDFNYIIDKLSNKLQSWKTKLLSNWKDTTHYFYPLQHLKSCQFLLASKIYSHPDWYKIKRFLWGHDDNCKKIHTIGCDNIAKPRTLGGVGIRKSSLQNKTLLLNLTWKLENNPENLCSRTLKEKYGYDLTKRKTTKTFSFKGIQKILPLYKSCIKKIIGDGKSVNLWCDIWLNQPLRNILTGPLPKEEEKRSMSNIIKEISNCKSWHHYKKKQN